MAIQVVSPDDALSMARWDAFVASHPRGTPCHLSGWLRTIARTYGFTPLFYSIRDAGGAITAAFPFFKIAGFLSRTRIISLPFSDYGGPLLGHNGEGADILETIRTGAASGARCMEIRGQLPEEAGFIRHSYYKRHLFNLQRSAPEALKSIDKRTIHYSIRKAEKAGIVVRETRDEAGMHEFMRLNTLTRKKHGVPSQPHSWFEALQKNVISAGNGFLLLAELHSRVIGASIFLTCGRSLHYKYNASDPAALRSSSPNHLLTWSGIKWGIEHAFDVLDFGRTAPDNEGLMRYKTMWGTDAADLPYYYYPKVKGAASVKEKSFLFRLFTGFWNHIPDGIAEKLSERLFKQFA